MRCTQARRLFGACWDDETTQAEREWLESHFSSCPACRREYEDFTRAMELVGSLPRVEPAPDLLERVMSRTRRATAVPDRIRAAAPRWVPVTAAAALLALAGSALVPWIGTVPRAHRGDEAGPRQELRQPELVRPIAARGAAPQPARTTAPLTRSAPGIAPSGQLASVPDSLFDHSEDVEFILDPVTLRRGRATVTRLPAGVQGEKAVISF